MELIYEYLDPDVVQWLRDNAPKPMHGKNYFLWLSEQYGLKKLVEHIRKVIGVASACCDMDELRNKMQEIYGKKPGFQFQLKTSSAEGGRKYYSVDVRDAEVCVSPHRSMHRRARRMYLRIPAPNPARIRRLGEVVLALLRCHREKGGGILLHVLTSALRTFDAVFVVFTEGED